MLENLRKVIAYARDYQDEFVKQVTDNAFAEKREQLIASKRQLEQLMRRIAEIDTIIQHLYEDVVKSQLTNERFAKMSAAYEKEQKSLEVAVSELRKTIEANERQKNNVNSFLKLVKSYTEPETLTPEVLRMFVEKIIVHEPDKSSGHRVQQIEIFYNFVGQVDKSMQTAKVRRRSAAELAGENLRQHLCN